MSVEMAVICRSNGFFTVMVGHNNFLVLACQLYSNDFNDCLPCHLEKRVVGVNQRLVRQRHVWNSHLQKHHLHRGHLSLVSVLPHPACNQMQVAEVGSKFLGTAPFNHFSIGDTLLQRNTCLGACQPGCSDAALRHVYYYLYWFCVPADSLKYCCALQLSIPIDNIVNRESSCEWWKW